MFLNSHLGYSAVLTSDLELLPRSSASCKALAGPLVAAGGFITTVDGIHYLVVEIVATVLSDGNSHPGGKSSCTSGAPSPHGTSGPNPECLSASSPDPAHLC